MFFIKLPLVLYTAALFSPLQKIPVAEQCVLGIGLWSGNALLLNVLSLPYANTPFYPMAAAHR